MLPGTATAPAFLLLSWWLLTAQHHQGLMLCSPRLTCLMYGAVGGSEQKVQGCLISASHS